MVAHLHGADETEAEEETHETADRSREGDPSDFLLRQVAFDIRIADVNDHVGDVVAAVRVNGFLDGLHEA